MAAKPKELHYIDVRVERPVGITTKKRVLCRDQSLEVEDVRLKFGAETRTELQASQLLAYMVDNLSERDQQECAACQETFCHASTDGRLLFLHSFSSLFTFSSCNFPPLAPALIR